LACGAGQSQPTQVSSMLNGCCLAWQWSASTLPFCHLVDWSQRGCGRRQSLSL
jgi:hypothetical protein